MARWDHLEADDFNSAVRGESNRRDSNKRLLTHERTNSVVIGKCFQSKTLLPTVVFYFLPFTRSLGLHFTTSPASLLLQCQSSQVSKKLRERRLFSFLHVSCLLSNSSFHENTPHDRSQNNQMSPCQIIATHITINLKILKYGGKMFQHKSKLMLTE